MKNIIFFVMSLILVSCSTKNRVPQEILQKKEMQDVLWDVMRAQALSAEMARKDSTLNEVTQTKILTQKVFEIHHITSSVFDQSYAWYTSHPQVMRIIFDSMNIQNQRHSELRMKEGYKPFVKDSLKSKTAYNVSPGELQKQVSKDSIKLKTILNHRQNELKMKQGQKPVLKDSVKLKAILNQRQNELRINQGHKLFLKDSLKLKAINKQRQSELRMKRGYRPLLRDSLKNLHP